MRKVTVSIQSIQSQPQPQPQPQLQLQLKVVKVLVVFGLLSFPAVVNSFTTIPLQCSLREPGSSSRHHRQQQQQQSQFKVQVPQIPFFNTNNIVSTNASGSRSNNNNNNNSNADPSSLGNRRPKLSKKDEEEYTAMKKGIEQEDMKILQNRSAIMEHALQCKSKELDTMNRRNTLLQDVVKKLQLSNRNLLDKVHQLQHEKEGMHINTDSGEEELWPPEMEMEVLKEEFNSKEMEWQNALETAQWKYARLRDEYLDVQMKLSELMEEISDAQEKALYYEERAAYDDNEINGLRVQVAEKEGLIEELKLKSKEMEKEMDAKMKTKNNKDDNESRRSKVLESKLEELESKVAELEVQNENAKGFIQDLRKMSKEKRDSITQIVMNEREKNRCTVNKLKSAQAANIELKTELNRTTDDLKNLKAQVVENAAKETKIRQEEEEERVKSLDVATTALRQAESRENELKKKLTIIEKKLNKEKEEKLALSGKIKVLESASANEQEEEQGQKQSQGQDNQNIEPTGLENDLMNQINELEVELSKVQDSRDILCRQELRLKQVLAEDRQRHEYEISTNKDNWEKKLMAQKTEFDLVEKELRSEIALLNDTINQQEMKIDELSLKFSLKASSLITVVESTNDIGDDSSRASSEANSSRRFKRIRKRVRKLKEWLRS